MKGRVTVIQASSDHKVVEEDMLEPTPEFDFHLSRRFRRRQKMNDDILYDASQYIVKRKEMEVGGCSNSEVSDSIAFLSLKNVASDTTPALGSRSRFHS